MKKFLANKLRDLAFWLDPQLYMIVRFDSTQMKEIKDFVKAECDRVLREAVPCASP